MNLLLLWRKHDEHVHTLEFWPDLNNSCFGKILLEPLKQHDSEFLMCDLSSSKMNGCLHLVAVMKYPHRVVFLELIIVLVGAWAELNFLDGNKSLLLLRLFLLLFLLILPFAEVDNSANRRLSLRRNLDEIQTLTASNLYRLLRRHYSELRALVVDDANLTHSNTLVHADGRNAISPVPKASSLKAANIDSS